MDKGVTMARGQALRKGIQARQKSRAQRAKARQRGRTQRQKERQKTRRMKIGAKERSGAYTPEARAQRGAAIRNVVGTVAGAAGAIPGIAGTPIAGALGALGGIGDVGSPVGDMGESEMQSWGGEFGNGEVATTSPGQEETPIWKNPIAIGVAALAAFLLLRRK